MSTVCAEGAGAVSRGHIMQYVNRLSGENDR